MIMNRSAVFSFLLATAVFAHAQTVENVILMIPDGCSGNLVELYKMVSKQDPKKFPPLAFEDIQTGMICTLNCDGRTTDSAAAGTAYATGVKTKNAYLSMSPDGKMLPTIAEKAKKKGLGVGLLTSDSINGATPSAFCAHVSNRGKVEDIKTMREAQGFDVVEGSERKNRLSEKTTDALQLLSKNKKGFFLMVEGGEIDHAQHANNPVGALEDLEDFNRAVAVVRTFVKSNGKTLLIIAPDHDTGGMTITGTNLVSHLLAFPLSPKDMTKKLEKSDKALTVSSVSAAIAQEYKVTIPMEELEKVFKANEKEYGKRSKKDQVQHVLEKVARLVNTYVFGVSYTTGGHTEIDVPLWSTGPKAMSGKVDNTDVSKHIANVLGL
ncbi:MAG: alkaline phosphatase [bacterium]